MPARTNSKSRSRSRGRTKSASQSKAVASTQKNGSSKARKSRSISPPNIVDDSMSVRVSRRIQDKIQRELSTSISSDHSPGDMVRKSLKITETKVEKVEKKPFNSPAKEVHSEPIAFGGAVGGAALTIFLPLVVYALVIACDKSNGCRHDRIPFIPKRWQQYFDVKIFGVVLGWYVFQAMLALIPLGPVVKGQVLRDGRRLNYRCNGLLALLVTVCVFALLYFLKYDMSYVYQHWLQFVTASIFLSFVLAVFLYVKALNAPAKDHAPESTGSMFNDFFMGLELNPRIGNLDLKFFFELRPGLIGWMLIDWSLCASQMRADGSVHPALFLVTLFQTIYVLDALKNESSILTTMDITTEGFGFMLAFGDLAWVPCLYSLQAYYIYTYPQHAVSNPYALGAICLLEIIGLVIFRGANSQKDQFRNNPNNPAVAHLKTIPTATGKKLLVSGYWGLCRRPNYFGDLLMATAWSLTCGFVHLLPYFYPIHFFILLSHRQMRDEAYCKQKYGAAWEKYCHAVPCRLIPYIF
ncbi:delta(14)-sterol reductase TM7SF2-like [Watersipora subatra]|uniref:delta(14)-sterol reductase TM7SF2-like n=1 Tax=Watersipora subatra TaxID=2589382 RepID=UPI00355BAFF8